MLQHIGDKYTADQSDELFRGIEVDQDGKFDYRKMAYIMKYGNPDTY
jgi:Ca2+-binding EF-hand superfamily protein